MQEIMQQVPQYIWPATMLVVFLGMLAVVFRSQTIAHDLSKTVLQLIQGKTPTVQLPPSVTPPLVPPRVTPPPTVPPRTVTPLPPAPLLPPAPPKTVAVPVTAPPAGPPVSVHDTPQIARLKAANAHRWAAMHVKADKIAAFDKTAQKLCAPEAKARYEKISTATGVPWFAVAVIHEREANGNFNAQLGQGDPLGETSVHVPIGRGPFFNHPTDPPGEDAFYRGALDALIDCPPQTAKWKDWSIGGLLTILEEYNGLGYAARGVPSAYVWSGSDQYEHGKFIADHVYSDSAVDVQEGCAPLLSRMAALDPSIHLG